MPRDLDAVLDGMGWQLDDTERAGALDWSHGDAPLASDIVAFFAETPEGVRRAARGLAPMVQPKEGAND